MSALRVWSTGKLFRSGLVWRLGNNFVIVIVYSDISPLPVSLVCHNSPPQVLRDSEQSIKLTVRRRGPISVARHTERLFVSLFRKKRTEGELIHFR